MSRRIRLKMMLLAAAGLSGALASVTLSGAEKADRPWVKSKTHYFSCGSYDVQFSTGSAADAFGPSMKLRNADEANWIGPLGGFSNRTGADEYTAKFLVKANYGACTCKASFRIDALFKRLIKTCNDDDLNAECNPNVNGFEEVYDCKEAK